MPAVALPTNPIVPQVRATAVHALKYVAEVGHVQALQGCLHRIKREEWFIRASALDAFCNICHSDDPVLMQVDSLRVLYMFERNDASLHVGYSKEHD